MKDRENVLRWLDEIDNMIMLMDMAVNKGTKIEPQDARMKFNTIRKKLQVITDRVSGS